MVSFSGAYIALYDNTVDANNGVYYTQTFTDADPTWTKLTTGITYREINTIKVSYGGAYCYLLQGDRSTQDDGDIWRWDGATWGRILSNSEAEALITAGAGVDPDNGTLQWIAIDNLASSLGRENYLYAAYLVFTSEGADNNGLYFLRSTDAGETWSYRGSYVDFPTRLIGNFLVFGDSMIAGINNELVARGRTISSGNGGQTWTLSTEEYGRSSWSPVVIGEEIAHVYIGGMADTSAAFSSDSAQIYKSGVLKNSSPSGSGWLLQDGTPNFAISRVSDEKSYAVDDGTLWYTTDDWSTYSTETVANNIKQVYAFPDGELVLCKRDNVDAATPEVLFFSSDDGATLSNKTGNLPSDPVGVAYDGFQKVKFDATVITLNTPANPLACLATTFTLDVSPFGGEYASIVWTSDNLVSGQGTTEATYKWTYPGWQYVRAVVTLNDGSLLKGEAVINVLENYTCLHCPEREFILGARP